MSEIETRLALLERAIEDAKHRARNDRMIASLLETEIQLNRRDLVSLKSKLYAGVSVALALGPLFAWLLELLR